tara:strand:- start:94 stop:522 length:429 start_codon:yes stop_codon:yes gene_type:complete
MKIIMDKNPFMERYSNNNDIFIHIRVTDAKIYNPGQCYYLNCIKLLTSETKYDKVYIGSDDFNDDLVQEIKSLYPNIIFLDKDPIETIQFGSTCKHIILSHGSFSAIIGYLAFFSTVYYPNMTPLWCPLDMFIEKGFIPIDV